MIGLRLTAVMFLALNARALPDPADSALFDGVKPPAGLAPLRLPAAARPPTTASILVRLFDGARRPLSADVRVLLRVFDGNHRELVSRFVRGPEILVTELPIKGNFADNYIVTASASRLKTAGMGPMRLYRGIVRTADLMLPPASSRFDFSGASWDAVRLKNPTLAAVLARGRTADHARERYERLMAERPAVLAGLLNLATALEAVDFDHGTALEHVEGLIWNETMQRDRFEGYVRADLLDDLKAAVARGEFALAHGAGILHPGAIISFKQTRYDSANIQLTFHPAMRQTVNGKPCMRVEVDIDKYRGLAHILLEVLPDLVKGGRTDPRDVYPLRWMAGRGAGEPEFDPLFTLAR